MHGKQKKEICKVETLAEDKRHLIAGLTVRGAYSHIHRHCWRQLYLATFEATKKWTMPLKNWSKVYGELSIMYPERLPE